MRHILPLDIRGGFLERWFKGNITQNLGAVEAMSKFIPALARRFSFKENSALANNSSLLQDVVLFFIVACLGVLASLVIAEPWEGAAPAVPAVEIDGVEIPTGSARPESLLKVARGRLQANVTLKGPGFSMTTRWSELGASVDLQSLGELLSALGQPGSAAAEFASTERESDAKPSVALPITVGSATAVEALVALKDTIDRPSQDAKFDFKSHKVLEEKDGLSLDVYGTLLALSNAIAKGAREVNMAVERVPATVTREKLKKIDISSVLGFFETPYSQMIKDKDRTYNVKLGSRRLDGQVILPQETFSFNDVLGERSEARGFRYAPVIAGGVLVEGMGGGTCQVASTLYAASFFSGLIVLERQTHSRPSSYIKLGLDATVSYPDLDLKLKNPFEFPIVIHFDASEGVLRAEIRGKVRPYTVTLLRKVIGQQPFQVKVVDDPNLLAGKEVVTQNGIPGYMVRRYQIIESDKVGYRFQTIDKYPPTTQFVHLGAAAPGTAIDSAEAPKPDKHKPYRAATYLRMVQGTDGLWYERSHE